MTIELLASAQDDPGFISLVQRIVNGAVAALRPREVYLVQLDNWFDHKWLGWWSWNKEKGLCVPPFNPNRVGSQRHFIWNASDSRWEVAGSGKALHTRQPGRSHLAVPLDQFCDHGAFVWYSGNTKSNKTGSLMLYLSGAEGYSWYASLKRNETWQLHDEFRITRRELVEFVERGSQAEVDAARIESS